MSRGIRCNGQCNHSAERCGCGLSGDYAEELEALREKHAKRCREQSGNGNGIDFDEARADAIGRNGNDGEHYR